MKHTFTNPWHRLIAAVTLACLLLSGAAAQEVFTEPTLEIGYGELVDLQASPDGKHFVASAGHYTGIRLLVLDLETGRVSQRFEPLFDPRAYKCLPTTSLALSADGSLLAASEVYRPVNDDSGFYDQMLITVRDAATGTLVCTIDQWEFLASGFWEVLSLAWSSDSARLLAGFTRDGTARLCDVETGAVIREFVHPDRIHDAALSPDGSRVLTGGRRGYSHIACLWDASTGELIRQWPFLEQGVAVAFSPDSASLLMGNDSVYLYDASSGQLIRKFDRPASENGLASVAFSPDGTRVLASEEYMYQPAVTTLWDASTAELLQTLEGESASFTRTGQAVLTRVEFGWGAHGARLCDAETGETIRTFEDFTPIGEWMEFSPDGAKLLTGSAAAIWNVKTGRLIRRLNSEGRWGGFSPDGAQVTVARHGYDEVSPTPTYFLIVDTYDTATGELLRTFQSKAGYFVIWENAVAFSPDYTRVAIGGGGGGGLLEVWDLTTGALVRRFRPGTEPGGPEVRAVVEVALSPDGQSVFGGADMRNSGFDKVQMWHIEAGDLVWQSDIAPINNGCLFIPSSDGRGLLLTQTSWGDDNYADFLDASSGQLIRSFPGRPGAFSPDDTKVLTVADDGFRLWDAETGQLLVQLVPTMPYGNGVPVAFSPDGDKVVTCYDGGSALLWSLVPDITLNVAREPSGTLVLSWQNAANSLQQRLDLSTGEWIEVTVTTPGRYEITDPNGTRFYRLKEP